MYRSRDAERTEQHCDYGTYLLFDLELVNLNGGNLVVSCHRRKHLQEMFHVYLNKFENAVTHLFLVILGNN